ncbi:hypothetical protein XSR1_210026 [Xenorhabdus szentirmaii DSM 16338]|uniref:Uncharacterized protein n=1 Tax=Xenorhabdus szentirmaii DSM 16338 TaxID=1427518 RepID=W1IXN8_9GAMM|nr:hypothetical protein XSR1_210026 [Xenorhabdus szentirmaii DSM 16338]
MSNLTSWRNKYYRRKKYGDQCTPLSLSFEETLISLVKMVVLRINE